VIDILDEANREEGYTEEIDKSDKKPHSSTSF